MSDAQLDIFEYLFIVSIGRSVIQCLPALLGTKFISDSYCCPYQFKKSLVFSEVSYVTNTLLHGLG